MCWITNVQWRVQFLKTIYIPPLSTVNDKWVLWRITQHGPYKAIYYIFTTCLRGLMILFSCTLCTLSLCIRHYIWYLYLYQTGTVHKIGKCLVQIKCFIYIMDIHKHFYLCRHAFQLKSEKKPLKHKTEIPVGKIKTLSFYERRIQEHSKNPKATWFSEGTFAEGLLFPY